MIKFVLPPLALLLLPSTATVAAPDAPGRMCLLASAVEGTAVVDNNTVIYRMKNGKVWKNTLRASCPNLKFAQGFTEVIRSDQICANQQIITVVGTGNPCQLGEFSPVESAKPQAN